MDVKKFWEKFQKVRICLSLSFETRAKSVQASTPSFEIKLKSILKNKKIEPNQFFGFFVY